MTKIRGAMWAVLVLIVGIGGSMAVPAGAQGTNNPEVCFYKAATIVGTADADVLQGTDGDDVIVGLGGDDVIDGGGGNDLICGGGGADTLRGGSGDDAIDGGSGADKLFGDAGSDSLDGRRGRDRLSGGSGDDDLTGGDGTDRCGGGRGKDFAQTSCETIRADLVMGEFDHKGATVNVVVLDGRWPEQASKVMFRTTVIPSEFSDRAKVCVGPIEESSPPNCGGFYVKKFDSSVYGGRSGSHQVVVKWPPVDRETRLISQSTPPLRQSQPSVREPIPEECAELSRDTATEYVDIRDWGEQNLDVYGGVWTAFGEGRRNTVPVLQIFGSEERIESVRAELATETRTPCIIQVDFTVVQIRETSAQACAAVRELYFGSYACGFGSVRIGVGVTVPIADQASVRVIVDAVDRPDLLNIWSEGFILR